MPAGSSGGREPLGLPFPDRLLESEAEALRTSTAKAGKFPAFVFLNPRSSGRVLESGAFACTAADTVPALSDFAKRVNDLPDGWLLAMGVTITKATVDEVRAELTIGPEHLQGYGIVHGGVHCGLIESLASIGAALVALPRNQSVVGLENSTSFVRAVRSGAKLHAVSTPITRGRRTQIWEARILDDQERIVAAGRVRLLCLEQEQELAGEQVRGVLNPPV